MSASEISRRGILLVLSSPSGAGKTTITRELVARESPLQISVSVTTRPPRKGEIDGKHYHFIARERFDAMVHHGELLEHASVFGHFYGTPRSPVEAALSAGRDIISDIDWQGTQQLAQTVRDDLVAIFVLPASMAKSADEMSHWPEYDYVFVNRDIAESVRQVQAILAAERVRRGRLRGLADFVNHLRTGRQA